jgi:lysophospholipase L1-like esterase
MALAFAVFVASMTAVAATPEKTMVILGASYAADWPIQQLGVMRVVNKGVGGDESHRMLARFGDDVVAHKPSTVLIWGFINDVFRSPHDSIDATLERTRQNVAAMVEQARKNGIHPILATEVTITTRKGIKASITRMIAKLLGKKGYHDYVNGHVRAVNEWMRGYANQQGIPLLDFEQVLARTDGEREPRYAVEDGSHLSAQAYDALTAYAAKTFIGQ